MRNCIYPFVPVLVLTMTRGCWDSSGTQESRSDIGFPLLDISDGGVPLQRGFHGERADV